MMAINNDRHKTVLAPIDLYIIKYIETYVLK